MDKKETNHGRCCRYPYSGGRGSFSRANPRKAGIKLETAKSRAQHDHEYGYGHRYGRARYRG
mgnify:CR=1 FL=1